MGKGYLFFRISAFSSARRRFFPKNRFFSVKEIDFVLKCTYSDRHCNLLNILSLQYEIVYCGKLVTLCIIVHGVKSFLPPFCFLRRVDSSWLYYDYAYHTLFYKFQKTSFSTGSTVQYMLPVTESGDSLP